MESSLAPEVLLDFGEDNVFIAIFESVSQFDELIIYVVQQINLYMNQNDRVFLTDVEEMKAFTDINYIMGINKPPSLAEYGRLDDFIGNDGIKNVITRKHFLDILLNLHLVDKTTGTYKSNKSFKIVPVIVSLNRAFKNAFADDSSQSIDEHCLLCWIWSSDWRTRMQQSFW